MAERPLDRLRDLVLAAVEQPPDARAAFLADACGGDRALLDAARELLELDATAVAKVEDLASMDIGDWLSGPAAEEITGEQDSFDRFTLREVIGRGGSSTVFRAEQIEPVVREVALKVLQSQRLDPVARERFHAEQQILAMLDHPHVARVYDAGTTPAGQPYFAMELVRGPSLTRYCDARELDLTARCRLLQQACAGVEHAHRKGMLHRDLKPSNLLVAEHDGQAVVKVIDFGIARPLATRDDPQWTLAGHMLGTPQYMSPEQARDDRRCVDVRSDVFSLGVVLHELVTGTVPYDTDTDSALAMLGAVSRGEIVTRSRDHHGRPLPRDLLAILRKATDVDPEQRYESPAALARDIENLLGARPVVARQGGSWYQLTRLARRHPLGSGLAAALLVVILVATTTVTVLYQRAEREAARARLEASTATSLAEYLRGMFVEAAPSGGDPHVTIPEVLDRAAVRAEDELADRPVVLAEVLDTLAGVKADLGEKAKAHEIRRIARRVLEGLEEPGVEPLRTRLDAKIALNLPDRSARRPAALAVLASLADLDIPAPERARIAYTIHFRLGEQAGVRQDQELAAHHLEQAYAALERSGNPDESLRLQLLVMRGKALWSVSDHAPARPLLVEALEGYERHLGPNDARTMAVLSTLAAVEGGLGEYESAMARQKQLVDRAEAVLGPDHVIAANYHNNYGLSLAMAARTAEALSHLRLARDLWCAKLPEGHPHIPTGYNNVAYGFLCSGQYAAAHAHADTATMLGSSLDQPRPFSLAGSLSLRGASAYRLGRFDEAAADLRRAIATVSEAADQHNPFLLPTYSTLASLQLDRGDVAGAATTIAVAREIVATQAGVDPRHRLMVASVAARVRLARGETEAAMTALADLEDDLLGDHSAPDDRRRELARWIEILSAHGDRARAQRWKEALDGLIPAVTVPSP